MELSIARATPSKLTFTPDTENLAWKANLRVSKLISEEQLLNDEGLADLHPLRQFVSQNLAAVTKKISGKLSFLGTLQIDTIVVHTAVVRVATVTPLVVNDELGENESAIIALLVEFDVEWLHEKAEASLKDVFQSIEMGADITISTPENAPELRMVG